MEDPNCPKFLDGHVKKLKEAWEDTNEKAQIRKKTAANFRKGIQDIYDTVSGACDCLQQMLPEDRKQPMTHEVTEIKTRMDILGKTDSLLEFILDFNKRLAVF